MAQGIEAKDETLPSDIRLLYQSGDEFLARVRELVEKAEKARGDDYRSSLVYKARHDIDRAKSGLLERHLVLSTLSTDDEKLRAQMAIDRFERELDEIDARLRRVIAAIEP
jgi:hypothetical protein